MTLKEQLTKRIINNGIQCLDGLYFVKDNCYWLLYIGHEKMGDIFCKNEEKYNYLKSIGLEFWKDHYIEEEKYKIDF